MSGVKEIRIREVKQMERREVGSKVNIIGTVVEVVENEEVGIRYKVKIKSNDTIQTLWFEADELNGGVAP